MLLLLFAPIHMFKFAQAGRSSELHRRGRGHLESIPNPPISNVHVSQVDSSLIKSIVCCISVLRFYAFLLNNSFGHWPQISDDAMSSCTQPCKRCQDIPSGKCERIRELHQGGQVCNWDLSMEAGRGDLFCKIRCINEPSDAGGKPSEKANICQYVDC